MYWLIPIILALKRATAAAAAAGLQHISAYPGLCSEFQTNQGYRVRSCPKEMRR